MSIRAAGTIVALGGGGFSISHDGRSLIDDHILELSGVSKPRVCFVPTASGDSRDYRRRFEEAFSPRARTSILSLFGNPPDQYRDPEVLLDQDVIYVGGGSTANLLAIWRLHGVPKILRAASENGTILAGISAGMNCWFEQSSTDSFGELAPLKDGLGFIQGSACPHYLSEPDRRQKYRDWIQSGELDAGFAVDDHAAVVFTGGILQEAVSEQPSRPVSRISWRGEGLLDEPLDVRLLRG